jgi:hypothetical protein
MKMATEYVESKYHLCLSVHRVFWNMQRDILGVILIINVVNYFKALARDRANYAALEKLEQDFADGILAEGEYMAASEKLLKGTKNLKVLCAVVHLYITSSTISTECHASCNNHYRFHCIQGDVWPKIFQRHERRTSCTVF